jgi:hypothetical protein
MTEHCGQDLPEWLAQADATDLPPLRSFTRGPRNDLDAATAGLALLWNSGPSKDTSTGSRCSSAKCMAARPSTYYSASSPPEPGTLPRSVTAPQEVDQNRIHRLRTRHRCHSTVCRSATTVRDAVTCGAVEAELRDMSYRPASDPAGCDRVALLHG